MCLAYFSLILSFYCCNAYTDFDYICRKIFKSTAVMSDCRFCPAIEGKKHTLSFPNISKASHPACSKSNACSVCLIGLGSVDDF